MLVVVTTLPEMLSEVGDSRNIWPVDVVTMTNRILPLLSVTTWLTVPSVVPVVDWTVRPVVRPGRVELAT
jgi:predicted transcriptional regulator